jgi:putative restriction endonuclease
MRQQEPTFRKPSYRMPNVAFTEINLGSEYSRQQLAEIWGYRAYQAIARGVVTPAGHDKIVLFVTHEKQRSAQQYEDRLDGDRLYWEGPTDHFAEERIINARRSGDEIHLFYRDRHHSNFRYQGQLGVLEVVPRTASPSGFVFKLIDG